MASTGVQLNALDPRSLADLKQLTKTSGQSDEALRAASKQAESLFLHMMLKAMRDATPSDGPMDSEQTRMSQQLFDQQLSSNLAQAKGVGLAEALFRQLGGGKELEATAAGVKPAKAAVPAKVAVPAKDRIAAAVDEARRRHAAGELHSSRSSVRAEKTADSAPPTVAESAELSAALAATAGEAGKNVPEHVRNFVASVWPYAREAARLTGIPAHFMVAQAALETGWGAKQPKNADGSPSYNLFNIKANRGWAGENTGEKTVREYASDGSVQRQKSAFRSYASYAEAFADYAKMLTASPRYASVVGQNDAAAFAQGLKDAGYATDPMYADKLVRIISGKTLQNALVMTG
jgi:flagellar protein FlgJ